MTARERFKVILLAGNIQPTPDGPGYNLLSPVPSRSQDTQEPPLAMALNRGLSHLGVAPTACFVCGWGLQNALPGPLARGQGLDPQRRAVFALSLP